MKDSLMLGILLPEGAGPEGAAGFALSPRNDAAIWALVICGFSGCAAGGCEDCCGAPVGCEYWKDGCCDGIGGAACGRIQSAYYSADPDSPYTAQTAVAVLAAAQIRRPAALSVGHIELAAAVPGIR